MKAQTVDVKVSTGRVLCCTVFRPSNIRGAKTRNGKEGDVVKHPESMVVVE